MGTWYLCLDTSGDGTELTTGHLIETQLDPSEISFPQHYAPLASVEVTATGMGIDSFRTVIANKFGKDNQYFSHYFQNK